MAKEANIDLVGRKIVAVRPLTTDESGFDYTNGCVGIELDNGTVLFASKDEEGNGPGAMFGTTKTGRAFTLYIPFVQR